MFSDKIVCAIRVMNLLAYSPPGQRSARGYRCGLPEGTARRGILTLQIRNQHAHHRQHLLHHGAHGLSRQRGRTGDCVRPDVPLPQRAPHGRRDRDRLEQRRLPARQALRASAASGDRNRGRAQAAAEEHARAGTAPPGSGKHVREETGRRPADSPGETIRDQIPAHADSPLPEPS